MTHLESLSNGLGAQSMWLLFLATRGDIPATVSITADTGWENDRLWSTGRRSSSEVYFTEVVKPLAEKYGIEAFFVRSLNKTKQQLPTLREHVVQCARIGQRPSIPMFGSKGGRLTQTCTDKWKIRACRQIARSLGAATNCNAQGIHYGEAARRVKGRFLFDQGCWSIYQTTVKRDGKEVPVKWQTHYYPLVDLRLRREQVQKFVEREKIPYLISTECDGCPHKDLARWERTAPETMKELAALEAQFGGQYFFTSERLPLLEALESMRSKQISQPELDADFGCKNDICGI